MVDGLQLSLFDFVKDIQKIKVFCDNSNIEEVGLITKNGIKFLKNDSFAPYFIFSVDISTYKKELEEDSILFYWHSHVLGSCSPSEEDIRCSENFDKPCLIYSKKDKNFSVFNPQTHDLIYFSL